MTMLVDDVGVDGDVGSEDGGDDGDVGEAGEIVGGRWRDALVKWVALEKVAAILAVVFAGEGGYPGGWRS